MILFSLYAVAVWFAAARYRRRWGAFAAVGAGVAGLVLVALFHIQLARWSGGRIFLPVLQTMLYPYIGLVGLIGAYLSCLPRTLPLTWCARCRYDLKGLEGLRCPECGEFVPDPQRALLAARQRHVPPGAPDQGGTLSRARIATGLLRPASEPAIPE